MNSDRKIIKDDINFLEYPNWVIDRKNKNSSWTIEKPHGKYEIISPLGLPRHLDKIVLYFLLYKLYREKDFTLYTLTTTRYEIAKNIFSGVKDFGKNKYDRIMQSLKRWKAFSIYFEGLFYGEDGHTIRGFSILDEFMLKKDTGELTIKFNESYVKQLKETKFYKLIDFESYKKLHKASSARLYEILVKNFKERSEWPINIQILAEKLTFEKRAQAQHYYPSDILRYLKPSINEINKKTDLYVGFEYYKDTAVCLFKKLKKPKESFIAATKEPDKKLKKADTAKQMAACLQYFATLSESEQKKIIDGIKRQPFLAFLSDQETRIFAYMTKNKQWPVAQIE